MCRSFLANFTECSPSRKNGQTALVCNFTVDSAKCRLFWHLKQRSFATTGDEIFGIVKNDERRDGRAHGCVNNNGFRHGRWLSDVVTLGAVLERRREPSHLSPTGCNVCDYRRWITYGV